jgi:uncharacterized repeat protein (TIGR03803 family)
MKKSTTLCENALIIAALLLAAVNADAAQYTKLFDFSYTNGAGPHAGVVAGSALYGGTTLYGTTEVGGTNANANPAADGTGTIFKINADGTGFVMLHCFSSNTNYGRNSDGVQPWAGLVLSSNTLYGTAREGGDNAIGTIFKINTDGAAFTTLHSFSLSGDGWFPVGELVLCSNTLYGTASYGGIYGNGTIFKINTDGTGFTTLHSFAPWMQCDNRYTNSDGAHPYSGLILSGDTLYGTTRWGGPFPVPGNWGYGVIFKINTDGNNFTVLHAFSSGADGEQPLESLSLSGSTLYGRTIGGGDYGFGTIFKINTDGTGYTNLFNFNDGTSGSLVLSGDLLYGTCGAYNTGGQVFAITTNGTGFTSVYIFPKDEVDFGDPFPNGTGFNGHLLAFSGDTLYGTTGDGGTNYGTGVVFELSLVSDPAALVVPYIESLNDYDVSTYGWYGGSYSPAEGSVIQIYAVFSGIRYYSGSVPATDDIFAENIPILDDAYYLLRQGGGGIQVRYKNGNIYGPWSNVLIFPSQ